MVAFRTNPMRELARQLRRSPKRLVLRHLTNIEFALTVIEADKTYPFEFLQHAITGVRAFARSNSGLEPVLLKGNDLRQDLVSLAEFLSGTAQLPLDACDGAFYSGEQLAQRFGISLRTVSRWRKRGLAVWKVIGPDGRLHTVFHDKSVRRFVSENVGLVRRASSFSQLAPHEHQMILARARELARDPKTTFHAVSVRIASETGRGRETIRLILKQHDERHPQAAIFSRRVSEDQAEARRLQIWEAYQDGTSLARLAEQYDASVGAIYEIVTRMRAHALQSSPVEYIAAEDFESAGAEVRILNDADALHPHAPRSSKPRVPPDLPPYLRELFDLPLLTPAGEAALFRKMNFLKYMAQSLQRSLDSETATAAQLDRLELLLAKAGEVKNLIVQANLRLVVRFAKRYQTPQYDLFELISEGNMALLRAVDLFDFTRGFKFSTYASWAIIRQLTGSSAKAQQRLARFQTGQDEWCEVLTAEAEPDHADGSSSTLLQRMADALSRRQWYVLSRHYGLDEQRRPRTLEEIGRRLGVSKERVRQIEAQALGLLRKTFADEVEQLWN